MIKKNIRKWQGLWCFLAFLGILISCYALDHHLQIKIFGSSNAMCNINDLFNCDRIAKSPFSEILGIPLGAFGLCYFFTILCTTAWGMRRESFLLPSIQIYSLLASTGLLISFILSLISTFGIGAFCVTCISVYTVTFLQGVGLFFFERRKTFPVIGKEAWKGGKFAAVIFCMSLVLYSIGESSLMRLIRNPKYSAQANHFLQKILFAHSKKIKYDLNRDIWIGNPAAKVVLVEYIDHMCEACRQWAPLIEEAYLDFKDDILIILKQYPREKKCNPHITNRLHVGACDSALLAFCAWKKNKYWEFQKVLFAEKPYTTTNTNPKPIEAAKRVGLTDKEIKACLDSKEGLLKIQQDIEDGRALGITSTPGVHINGWHYNGMDSEEHLKYEINYHLNRTSR